MRGRVSESVATPRLDIGAPARWLRARLATTPGRIGLASAAVLIGAFVFGLVAVTVERSRQDAAHSAATKTEPLLVQAVGLYRSLSDADATAARAFLISGVEPVAVHLQYVADLRSASRRLAKLSRRVDAPPGAVAALATITEQLPVYSGYVDTARADNRFGWPLGAAYLRQASGLMQEQILPAARRLYETEAARLNDSYRAGTGNGALVGFLLVGAVLIVPLVVAQAYLARATRRWLNPALLAATALVLFVWVWGTVALAREQSALTRAQREGSDPVEVLSAIRILAQRAQSDENLALIARGGGDANLADFSAVTTALTGDANRGGIVDEATGLAKRRGVASVVPVRRDLGAYLRAHMHTVALENDNRFPAAAIYAQGPESSRADRLDRALSRQVADAQRSFAGAGNDATRALSGLSSALPAAVIGCAVLALLGLQRRIREYR